VSSLAHTNGARTRSVFIGDALQRRSDLSTFVVYLTRDHDGRTARENLRSIIHERTLRAGDPRGWATWGGFSLPAAALETQRVTCFSEAPLEHINSLFADIQGRTFKFRGYGVALPRMVARRMGLNPVWYVDMTPGPGAERREWMVVDALNALVRASRESFGDHPISRLAPFIEGMGTWPQRTREFSWEREWRHLGDVNLDPWWSKLLWLCPEAELAMFEQLVGGSNVIDPQWGLERILGHLLGLEPSDMTPFATR
jgi:hypothetical protein